jgi:hypothetical protein
MKSIGIDCRSGIASAAVSLPIFLIGYCLLLFFKSSSIPTLFFALAIIACIATLTVGMMQSVWTKKTYARRLHKTTLALEDVSLGKTPQQLLREKYVLCSDIKQCPDDHSISDCLSCELYPRQTDLEKIGVIVRTLSHNLENQVQHSINVPNPKRAEIIEFPSPGAYIRRDPGFDRPHK